jgi:hypothetical protein
MVQRQEMLMFLDDQVLLFPLTTFEEVLSLLHKLAHSSSGGILPRCLAGSQASQDGYLRLIS